MIRINLLPSRESVQARAGKQFILLVLIALVAQGALLFYLQSEADAALKQVEKKNSTIQTEIVTLKKKTDAVAALEEEKAKLERQKAVLTGLEEGQSGPVKVLHAMGRLLRKVEDSTEKLRVQNLGWNPDWDPKNLWIDGFQEKNRMLSLVGHARTNEDLAEFLHRLNSSKHFANVELMVSQSVQLPSVDNVKFVQFTIEAIALYGPADVRRLANGELGAKTRQRR